jgi:hypothetical protein
MSDSGCLEPLPWETRNLGVESFAVSAAFFRKPHGRMLKKCLADLQTAHGDFFVQARFRSDTKTSQILEASGFYFVEATVCPYVALSRYAVLAQFVADPSRVLPRRYRPSDLDVVVAPAADRQMVASVRKMAGESFVDDRFHVDHNCDRETANRRYVLWVDDLFRDASVRFHVLLFRKQPIAFMASRAGDLLLAGFARRYASGGLGEFFWLRVLHDLRLDGVNGVSTLISVNNISALNLYARLNFKFREPMSTFHLWVRSTAT